MEINAGIFQGLIWPEINERFPEAAAAWRQDPDFRIPQGESRRDLMQRSCAALEAIREAGHRQAIVVAHGGAVHGRIKSLA